MVEYPVQMVDFAFHSHQLSCLHLTLLPKLEHMDTLSLAGKVAIITGSGRETGIGAGIATALARNGAWVVLNHVSDKTAPRAAKVAETLNQTTAGKAVVVQADVSSPEGAQTLVRVGLRLFGVDHVDILGMFTCNEI